MNAIVRGVYKQGIDRLMMFHMAVHNMDKSKEFYVDTMGFKVIKDYRQGDMHWVSLELPGSGTSIHLTTAHENMKSGTMQLSVSTADMQAAYKQLGEKGASQIADDLYGLGSGAKWFSRDDPDSNHWFIVQSK